MTRRETKLAWVLYKDEPPTWEDIENALAEERETENNDTEKEI